MNSIEQQPNLSVSKGGTLIVLPVDADALKKMINDAIADMNNKVTAMQQTIEDEIEALKNKANPNIDYKNRISYTAEDVATIYRKQGYIECPCDGFLSVITYWDDAWISINKAYTGWDSTYYEPNSDFIYYSWGIYKSQANGQGLIPVYKGLKLYPGCTRWNYYRDMGCFHQFIFLPFA